MVPTHLIELETFPLNASGKIDKSALPAPGAAGETAAYVEPRTLIETVLADMYARLLGHDRIGIDDGFFDLGGNSLQAMQLITQIDAELAADIDVNVTAVFLAPSPRRLAELLRDKHGLQDVDLSDEETAALMTSLE
jgi:acyl carrier protein